MPVRCAVCSSSFKESNALQMHKAAKCDNQSVVGNASGEKTSRDQAQTKPNPSNAGASAVDKVTSSGGLNFRCNSCNRSFRSREALEAHAKAKAHALTMTANIKRPEKGPFRCDVCSRYDFGSQNALNDHKRDSKGHQTRNQHSAPRKIATSYEGQKQQKMPLSNAEYHHPLALGYRDSSGKAVSCHFGETCTNSEECAIDAISQQTALVKDNSDGVPLAIPPVVVSQLAVTEDHLTLTPPNSQLSSKLVDVYGSVQSKPLEHLGKEWSTMSLYEQPLALKVLRDLCHSVSDLESNGYRFREYTFTDLKGGQKCKACKRQQRDIRQHKIPCKANLGKSSRFLQNRGPRAQPYDVSKQADQADDVLSSHTFPTIDGRRQNRYLGSTWTPEKDPQRPKCTAVALDCEMVDVVGNGDLWREVVQVSAVDFLGGETLINTLVLPTAKVKRWKTDITGITNQTLSEARAQGRTVKGWTEARSELWRHIDADTVLVGQSLHHDLEVLGMLHTRIVDTAILAAKAIDQPGAKTFGLKKLCREMLNVDVQCLGGGIHDCLEDVLASRELVLYFIYSPDEVQTWALSKRREELEKEARLQKQRKDRASTASSQDKTRTKRMVTDVGDDVSDLFDDDEEDREILRWEDIAEDLGWPHPDTGYDPWSD